MSLENVELAQRAVETFNRREIWLDWLHPEVEVTLVLDPLGADTFRGPSGVQRSIEKWWDAWGEITMQVDDVIDLGDQVVMAGEIRARGHDSEVVVTGSFGGAYEFRDGKVIRVRVSASRRGSRSRGAGGVGDVAGHGVIATTRPQARPGLS